MSILSTTESDKSNTITIVEHPGYFETQGDVFDIPEGKYKIVVKNWSGTRHCLLDIQQGHQP